MSPYVKAAFIATEDKRFYEHHGIDWFRVFGAIKNNVFKFRVAEGFSTITMQLARNLWPEDISGRDKTLRRKLREAHVALEIEAQVPQGQDPRALPQPDRPGQPRLRRRGGVPALLRQIGPRAQRRRGGHARRDPQGALPLQPAQESQPERPAPQHDPQPAAGQRAAARRTDTERWKAYPLLLSSHSDFSGVAEYFVEYVRQQLDARFGADLYKSGYRIYTTLDLDIQQAAERALEARLEAIESGADGKFAWPDLPPVPGRAGRHARTTAAGPRRPTSRAWWSRSRPRPATSGRWWAAATSRTASSTAPPRRCASRARPSSRSSTRPRVEAGYPLSHVMVDDPLTVEIATDTTPWAPQNYDLEFDGPMTLRRALYMSRNIIAIKLGMELGEEAVIGEAAKFGLTTRVPPYPSIHIGSADVIPLEMIAAYTTFANLGVAHHPERDPPGRGPQRQDRLAAAGAVAWPVMDTRARLADDRRAARRGAARHRGRLGRARGSTSRPAARPAPPTTASTSGSSGSRRTW